MSFFMFYYQYQQGSSRTGTPFPFFFYTTGTAFWHQLEKRLKMRINDNRNKKFLTNGILDAK